jgi:hypothetical protein
MAAVITWIDRIIDESNTWFNATKMEDMANYVDAVKLYLQDAGDSLGRGLLVRAGLSCSCAADCLVRMGALAHAKSLYSKSAVIYWENAHSPLAGSIREWLWSLQKAYENFLLADEKSKAEAVRGEYLVLAKRVDPFIREPKLQPPKLDSKVSGPSTKAGELPESVFVAVKGFMEQSIGPLRPKGEELATGDGREFGE